jgi:hypothetical protein
MNSYKLGAIAIFAVTLILGGMQTSRANTVTVSSDAAFLADTTDQVTTGFISACAHCFEGHTPDLVDNAITFTPNTTFVNVNSPHYYGADDLSKAYLVNSYTPASNGGPANLVLTIDLPKSVTAFGLDFSTLFTSTDVTFTLSNGFTDTVATNNGSTNFQTQFLGFLSTTPFDQITLSVPNVVLDGGNTSYVVEDVITAATPLPAALPLFATGLSALGLLGLRRKRKSAAGLAA